MIIFLSAAWFLLISTTPAQAAWIWTFECDAYGNCRQIPLCDSTLDIPPVLPLDLGGLPDEASP